MSFGGEKSEEKDDNGIIDDANGFVLLNTFFPEEIIITILTLVHWNDLKSCRLVCQSWRRLIEPVVCYKKLKTESHHLFNQSFTSPTNLSLECIPFYLYFAIGKNRFSKNLLKNGFGEDQFEHWNVIGSGGGGWKVEDSPIGSDPLPEELECRSCFVTSYYRSIKRQLIDLEECGLVTQIMDKIQPHFEVSEWYAARFDCGCYYKLKVALLDSTKNVIKVFETRESVEQWEGRQWHKISHSFGDYGPGVRYILYEHGGRDNLTWAGHYGSKMAGASVIARIPSLLFEQNLDLS